MDLCRSAKTITHLLDAAASDLRTRGASDWRVGHCPTRRDSLGFTRYRQLLSLPRRRRAGPGRIHCRSLQSSPSGRLYRVRSGDVSPRFSSRSMNWLLVQIDPFVVERLGLSSDLSTLARPLCVAVEVIHSVMRCAMLADEAKRRKRTSVTVPMVARRRHLPDLSTKLRRQRRQRYWRSPRDHGSPRLCRKPRRRTGSGCLPSSHRRCATSGMMLQITPTSIPSLERSPISTRWSNVPTPSIRR